MKNALLPACLLIVSALWPVHAAERSVLQTNDVICLIGGANVVSAQESGYLETFLRVGLPQYHLRIRSLAHEGDTVFAQPRDYNYPGLAQQVNETKATVVVAYFGQMEALDGVANRTNFIKAYERLLGTLGERRFVLVSPFVFETNPLLTNTEPYNVAAREYTAVIRDLATNRVSSYVDRFTGAKWNQSLPRFTSDGVHLNNEGQWYYDWMLATGLGVSRRQTEFLIDPSTGAFKNPAWERIRQTVISKNQLWSSYYRPTNWAFLGGDRTDQPSSRDHLNPKIRWFPDEMKRFVPLIDQSENEITRLAAAGGSSR